MSVPAGKLDLVPGHRFQYEEAQQAHVLLYPEGMVKLNDSAAEIIKRCDGSHTAEEIIQSLETQFPGVDLADDVRALLEQAHDRGWIHGR